MARIRVPIRGGNGKAVNIKASTVVQQTIVQQVVSKGGTAGVGAVAATIWPLISQIPVPVTDLAALSSAGLVVFDGTNIITRLAAVTGPLTISNASGAAGNPTIGLPVAALTKTDDTNVTLTLGGTPTTALLEATSIAVGWTGQLAVPRGGSGAATLTGYLVGNGTGPFTAVADIPAADVSGLATVATTGTYSDLSGLPTISTVGHTGNYSDLIGAPTLATVATTGELTDLVDVTITSVANGDVLTWSSADSKWENKASSGGLVSPLTTKGDIWGWDTTNNRIPVGADGDVLTADSTQALGVKWAAAGGTGTVTSVDMSVPSILTISGNPITTSGILALDLAAQNANLVFVGPATGSAAAPTFRSLVIADIPTIPAAHTSGFATVATTGAYSDLSGAPSLAAIATSGSASDLTTGTVPSARLPTASASVLGVVKVDGTSITISGGVISSTGGASGHNPTASVGLTAINGTATTFLRSDGASALDQSIAPIWTGTHEFTGLMPVTVLTSYASVGGLGAGTYPGFTFVAHGAPTDAKMWQMYVDETDGSYSLRVNNDANSVQSYPLVILRTGTTITAINLGTAKLNIGGAVTGLGPVSGALIDMTPDASSFTGTFTGMTTTVTTTCHWSRNGNQVTLEFDAASGTSNAGTFTMTGLPASLQPARSQYLSAPPGAFTDGGSSITPTKLGAVLMNASSGTVTFDMNDGAGWVVTGTKGINRAFSVTYLLN